MQLQGYVAAMQDPQVLRAIEIGPHKRIAVIFVEWGGENYQNIKVPWMLIDGKAAANGFSEALARHKLTALPRTSISSAALFSATLFEENGFNGTRRVIDMFITRTVSFARRSSGGRHTGLTARPGKSSGMNGWAIRTRAGLFGLTKTSTGWRDNCDCLARLQHRVIATL